MSARVVSVETRPALHGPRDRKAKMDAMSGEMESGMQNNALTLPHSRLHFPAKARLIQKM